MILDLPSPTFFILGHLEKASLLKSSIQVCSMRGVTTYPSNQKHTFTSKMQFLVEKGVQWLPLPPQSTASCPSHCFTQGLVN